jgi:hypothetical protein
MVPPKKFTCFIFIRRSSPHTPDRFEAADHSWGEHRSTPVLQDCEWQLPHPPHPAAAFASASIS